MLFMPAPCSSIKNLAIFKCPFWHAWESGVAPLLFGMSTVAFPPITSQRATSKCPHSQAKYSGVDPLSKDKSAVALLSMRALTISKLLFPSF